MMLLAHGRVVTGGLLVEPPVQAAVCYLSCSRRTERKGRLLSVMGLKTSWGACDVFACILTIRGAVDDRH